MAKDDAERHDPVWSGIGSPLVDQTYSHGPLEMSLLMAQVVLRQRAQGIHEPGCARSESPLLRWTSVDPSLPRVCTCWLSKCVLDSCAAPVGETGPRRVQMFAEFQAEGEWVERPSVPLIGDCPRCTRGVQVCSRNHCMICGTPC